MAAHTGAVSNPFGYAGEYIDVESGLHYLRDGDSTERGWLQFGCHSRLHILGVYRRYNLYALLLIPFPSAGAVKSLRWMADEAHRSQPENAAIAQRALLAYKHMVL